MQIYLIAKKLSHSFSPLIHSRLADYSYDLCELEESELSEFMKKRDFDGLNVTIPYKQTVMPMLDEISEEARQIGAVNTIKNSGGRLCGYNTDYYGFCRMAQKAGVSFKGKRVTVIGSGGASKTAVYAAKKHGASEVRVLSHRDNDAGNIAPFKDAEIIVNTTPVGMFPNTGKSPVSLDDFDKCEAVLDLIYNPARTAILLSAEKRGIKHSNGLSMLVAQASAAAEIFTGIPSDEKKADAVEKEIRAMTENIVLVGMPGCGKTTIGKMAAAKLGKTFYDIDEEIAKDGIHPSEIIKKYGEAEFRRIETEKCREICKKSGCVISTGGGAVTVAENADILRQNGAVIFIDRPVCELATDNRPLSRGGSALDEMYEKRLPMYNSVCDERVRGAKEKEETCRRVIEAAERSFEK